jgi:hypothetical protein
MSYSSATFVENDRACEGRRTALRGREIAGSAESSFEYLRNLPDEYPNALACPGESRIAMKPRTMLLVLLLLCCLIPRIVAATRIAGVCPDGVMYIRLATALEEGRFRDAFEGMNLNVYPPILMVLHRIGLGWEMAGELWGIAISTLVVLPLFGLMRRQFDDNVAVICCLLYAVHPVFLQWSAELIRDPTFWFFFTCTLYLLWRAVVEVRWGYFLSAGMTMTLAVLTRFEGLFLVIPLVLWVVWRYRALNEKPLRRRLMFGAIIAMAAFPAIIVSVNAIWLSGHSEWVFARLSPLKLVDYWWNGIMHPVAVPPDTPLELQNLSFFRLVGIYTPAMVKGLSPLFAVPMLIGLWGWRRVWSRRDHQTLFYTALLVLAAAWIHAWCGRESCDRYYLPIVLMASPFAALGLFSVCRWILLTSERFRLNAAFCRLAVLVPLAIVLLGSTAIAFRGKETRRAAEVKLAEQLRLEFGPSAKLYGSEGVTPVIAYYAGAQYATMAKAMDDRSVLDAARASRPDAILILATRRKDLHATRRLIDELCENGFKEIERNRLPAGIDDVLVVLERK